ncbi:MAG: GNAT family N-acetyltransferase [Bacillus sp. (in: firmicutes)]
MLTKEQLLEIKDLQKRCEQNESFQLKLNWDMLASRGNDKRNDFFHYEAGKLTGFLALYNFGNKYELCGMVDPDYRRKGIFTELFSRAVTELKGRKCNQLLLNAPAESESARAFLQQTDCHYYMSELQMKWSGATLEKDESVLVRCSEPRDLADEIQLEVRCFGFTEQEATEFVNSIRKVGNESFYIIEREGETVGKMRVDRNKGESWIYGFAVYPEHQGKGIGRAALKNIIKKERDLDNDIFLEVESQNVNALKLYKSIGFQAFHVQDYYEYQL